MDPSQVSTVVYNSRADASFLLACATLAFYDYFLTLPQEISYIWKGKFSIASVIYLLSRYLSFTFVIVLLLSEFTTVFNDIRVCGHVVLYQSAGTLVETLLPELILFMRVYALWECNKFVAGFFATVWVAQLIMGSYIISQVIAIPSPPGIPFLAGCIAGGRPPLLKVNTMVAIFPLVYDTCIFLFMIYAVYVRMRKRSSGLAGIVQVMLRDGVIYYFTLVISNAAFLITLLHLKGGLQVIYAPLPVVLVPILVNRMLLNLRAYSGTQALKGPAALQAFGPAQSANAHKSSVSSDSYELSSYAQYPRPHHYQHARNSSV